MLLTVDVGNTNITMGVMDGNTIQASFRMTTKSEKTSDEFGLTILEFLVYHHIDPQSIHGIIITSVVPKLMHSLTNAFIKYFHLNPFIVKPGIKTGIKLNNDNPKETGADRLVTAVAAHHIYGGNVLVIDFGTATTFDFIKSDGSFNYTVIAPGAQISANALWTQTAKLPEIEIVEMDHILAKNTINGMQAGIYYGYLGLVEKIIIQMKKELNLDQCHVVATGGLGRLFANGTQYIDTYDPDLIFKGMAIIYEKNHGKDKKHD